MKKLTQNVNKDKFMNDLPKVRPMVSTWLSRHANYQSSKIGRIVPIYFDEVLPDEEREIKMAMTSHTTTPIAPIFNSLYTEIRTFYIPYRLCADLLNGYKSRKSPFVKVFGEDNDSEDAKVIVPLTEQKLPEFSSEDSQVILDLLTYFGTAPEDNVFDSLDCQYSDDDSENLAKNNLLALAGYELVFQRHYRNENYEASTNSVLYRLLFDAYNDEKASVSLGSFDYEIANREKDYFTGMKPFTQKGDPISIGIGEKAKVYADATGHEGSDYNLHFKNSGLVDGTNYQLGAVGVNGGASLRVTSGAQANPVAGTVTSPDNLWADLTTAKGITVEQLRILIKTQELLEKDAMYGTRYSLSLNAHFGCCPLDETLQDPAELYKVTISSNMQAIFQTSSTSGESSILGTIGANSTTQTDSFTILPRTKFKEHGIIMICAVHKLQNVYDTRYFKPKMNFKSKRFDWYTPELNDLGFQPVKGGEEMLLASGNAGYNEAFAEYRYKFNKSHGSLNKSFPYWAPAISDEYETAAALYKEDPEILDKALSVTSSTAPQFYDAWGFEEKVSKPMSLHSIPGFDGVI